MDIKQAILENQNLIYKIAHSFNYQNKEDLFQAGCLGLVKASKNFDDSFNVKFTTYAYPYIVGEMKKLIREDNLIKTNLKLRKLILLIEKASIVLTQKLSREPNVYELSNYLEIEETIIADAILSKQKVESIDKCVSDDNSLTLHEVIEDNKKTNIDDLILLKQQLLSLNEIEQKIIQKRYYDDLTQSEIARELGMSQVQVSRSEQKALVKLKQKLTA